MIPYVAGQIKWATTVSQSGSMHNNGRLYSSSANLHTVGVRSLAYLFPSCLTKKYLVCPKINIFFWQSLKSLAFILATTFGLVVGMWLDEGRLPDERVSFPFFLSLFLSLYSSSPSSRLSPYPYFTSSFLLNLTKLLLIKSWSVMLTFLYFWMVKYVQF